MQILILGCGYLGGRVAAAYHADGHAVTALTRSPQRAADFHDRGWMPVVGDVTELLDTLSLPAFNYPQRPTPTGRRSATLRLYGPCAGLGPGSSGTPTWTSGWSKSWVAGRSRTNG